MEIENTSYSIDRSNSGTGQITIKVEISVRDDSYFDGEENIDLTMFAISSLHSLLNRETNHFIDLKNPPFKPLENNQQQHSNNTTSGDSHNNGVNKIQSLLRKVGEGVFVLGEADECSAHSLPRVLRFNSDEEEDDKKFWKAHEKPMISNKKKIWCHERVLSRNLEKYLSNI